MKPRCHLLVTTSFSSGRAGVGKCDLLLNGSDQGQTCPNHRHPILKQPSWRSPKGQQHPFHIILIKMIPPGSKPGREGASHNTSQTHPHAEMCLGAKTQLREFLNLFSYSFSSPWQQPQTTLPGSSPLWPNQRRCGKRGRLDKWVFPPSLLTSTCHCQYLGTVTCFAFQMCCLNYRQGFRNPAPQTASLQCSALACSPCTEHPRQWYGSHDRPGYGWAPGSACLPCPGRKPALPSHPGVHPLMPAGHVPRTRSEIQGVSQWFSNVGFWVRGVASTRLADLESLWELPKC